jgi:hypothetical protein
MIENKVTNSSLLTLDLEEWYPESDMMQLDIADLLVEGLLLREKDFRTFIAENDWTQYRDKHVALFCSTDAIIPRWAWMLLSTALHPYAKTIVFGSAETLVEELYREKIAGLDLETYRDQRVVIKGCSKKPVPAQAYVQLTARLSPVVKSIMYGEPCSTVPVFKRAKG